MSDMASYTGDTISDIVQIASHTHPAEAHNRTLELLERELWRGLAAARTEKRYLERFIEAEEKNAGEDELMELWSAGKELDSARAQLHSVYQVRRALIQMLRALRSDWDDDSV